MGSGNRLPDGPLIGRSATTPMRLLVALGALALVVESSLYSVLPPLLPHYAGLFAMDGLATALLSGCYPAGMIVGSLTAGRFVRLLGVRGATAAGFLMIVVATAAAGWVGGMARLDAVRVLQGMGGGFIWVGTLSWFLGSVGPERRALALGSALGASIAGTLVGPAVGTAAAVGHPGAVLPVYAAIAGLIGIVVVWAQAGTTVTSEFTRSAGSALGESSRLRFLVGANLLPGMYLGTMFLLVPLALADRGAGAGMIGATFLCAALVSAVLSLVVGRHVDVRGPIHSLGAGAAALVLGSLVFPLLPAWPELAVGTVLLVGVAVTLVTVPVMTMMSESATANGMALGATSAMINIVFASGELVGAPLSSVLDDQLGEPVPYALLALLIVVSAVVGRQHVVDRVQTSANPAAAGHSAAVMDAGAVSEGDGIS